jgi:AcrR family transcriptional regulator
MTPVTKQPEPLDDAAVEGPTRRGRPREEDRTPAILAATIALVDEVGYDDLRMQDVADRAGVGLATIYRRWPTKKDLFLDALRAKEFDLPDTGDARADLIAAYRRLAENVGGGSRLAVGCLAAEPNDPELLEAFRAVGVRKLQLHLRTIIARKVGEDDPDLDLRADLGPGVILQRSMMCGMSATDEPFLERLADLALGRLPR